MFGDQELRLNLFSLYVFLEIGGTGVGCFRNMYSRFLKEALELIGNEALGEASEMFHGAGKKFSEIGLSFKDVETMSNIEEKIEIASKKFNEIAILEEEICTILNDRVFT